MKVKKYKVLLESERHYKQATISPLKQPDGNFKARDIVILNQFEEFYKALYRPKIDSCTNTNDSPFFEKGLHRKLNLLELERSEESLTKEECLKALTEMERNETPGSDGVPAEFSGKTYLST